MSFLFKSRRQLAGSSLSSAPNTSKTDSPHQHLSTTSEVDGAECSKHNENPNSNVSLSCSALTPTLFKENSHTTALGCLTQSIEVTKGEPPVSCTKQNYKTSIPLLGSPYPWANFAISDSIHLFPRYGAAVNGSASRDGIIYLMGGLVNGRIVRDELFTVNVSKLYSPLRSNSVGMFECFQYPAAVGGPSPRVGHASLLLGNAFIVFGGDNKTYPNDALDNSLYLFNTATKRWSFTPPSGACPSGRYGHSLNALNSVIYVFGGQVEGCFFNDLFAFDLTQLHNSRCQWKCLISNGSQTFNGKCVPPARTNHTCVTWNNCLYLFGGTDGKTWFNDVWSYSPTSRSWTELSCAGYIPAAREGHAAALVGDIMYIFGGRIREGADLGDLAAFKLSTNRWYTFQNMGTSPSPRSGHSMTSYGKYVIVLGGEPSTSPRNPTELASAYVLDTNKIRYLANESTHAISGRSKSKEKPDDNYLSCGDNVSFLMNRTPESTGQFDYRSSGSSPCNIVQDEQPKCPDGKGSTIGSLITSSDSNNLPNPIPTCLASPNNSIDPQNTSRPNPANYQFDSFPNNSSEPVHTDIQENPYSAPSSNFEETAKELEPRDGLTDDEFQMRTCFNESDLLTIEFSSAMDSSFVSPTVDKLASDMTHSLLQLSVDAPQSSHHEASTRNSSILSKSWDIGTRNQSSEPLCTSSCVISDDGCVIECSSQAIQPTDINLPHNMSVMYQKRPNFSETKDNFELSEILPTELAINYEHQNQEFFNLPSESIKNAEPTNEFLDESNKLSVSDGQFYSDCNVSAGLDGVPFKRTRCQKFSSILSDLTQDDLNFFSVLLQIRSQLLFTQKKLEKDAARAAARIARVEKQRDIALSEAIFARAEAACFASSEQMSTSKTFHSLQSDLPANFSSETRAHSPISVNKTLKCKIELLENRLASSISDFNVLKKHVDLLLANLEIEKNARQLAENLLSTSEIRVRDLEEFKHMAIREISSLRLALDNALHHARLESSRVIEVVNRECVVKMELENLMKKLKEGTVAQNLRCDITSSSGKLIYEKPTTLNERFSILKARLDEEVSKRSFAEQLLFKQKLEAQKRTSEINNLLHRVRDLELFIDSEPYRLTKELKILHGNTDPATTENVEVSMFNEDQISILQSRFEAANSLIQQSIKTAEVATAQLRCAEEQKALVEAHRDRLNHNCFTARKQLQNALREIQSLQSDKFTLLSTLDQQKLEKCAAEIKFEFFKSLLQQNSGDANLDSAASTQPKSCFCK